MFFALSAPSAVSSYEKLLVIHDVTREEVEEVLGQRPLVKFVEKGHRIGENVYAAYGQSNAGRYLVVFFIAKPGQIALIISGRDMVRKERKAYERGK